MSTARRKKFSVGGTLSASIGFNVASLKIFGRRSFGRVNRIQRRVAENFRSTELLARQSDSTSCR
ncbi:MAG: hypothetical protein IKN16_09145 [Selenomonadaceae bacterium]|nr:hypothetical protein [Selenomonadaceae bacterium]